MLYIHTSAYVQDAESGLNPNDPKLDIKWSLPISEISSRDSNHALISDDFKGVML
jgi:dTDP-4-dehydrorhamnose 3,5-epimerase